MTRRSVPAPTAIVRAILALVLASALALTPLASLGATPGSETPTATAPADPTTPPMIGTGDSRSDGEGPGLVGSPVAIALGVVILGLITAVGTLVVLRVTGGRRE